MISTLSLIGCTQDASVEVQNEEVLEKKVKVQSVGMEKLGVANMISAELLPSSKATISAEISGNVAQKKVEVGAKVNRNQLLLELENKEMALNYKRDEVSADKAILQVQKAKDDQKVTVQQAESTVREREIALSDTKNSKLKYEQAVEQAKQNVTKLTMQYEALVRSHEEQKILLDHGAISQEDYNRSATQVSNMLLDLNQAKQQIEQAKKDLEGFDGQLENVEIQLTRAKQQLEQARARHNYDLLESSAKETQVTRELAKTQLDKRFITSPISGVVVKLDVNVGDSVNPQQVLAYVEQHEVLHASTFISEHEFRKVQGKEEIEVFFPVLNATKKGKIIFLSTSKNQEKNGFELRVEVDNQELALLPGMSTYLTLDDQGARQALTIPSNAMIEDSGQKYVYVIKDEIAHRRAVTIGEFFNMKVEIVEGLQEGETIAIVGQSLLNDQDKVKVIE